MINQAYSSIKFHVYFLMDFIGKKWAEMGPQEYTIILISVAVLGWFLMGNASKK